MNTRLCSLLLALLSILSSQLTAAPLGTAFTYQGKLSHSGGAATGLYDFSFTVWSDLGAGTQQGGTVNINAIGVTNGLFTATLDFGAVFDGNSRWLAIAVKTNGAATHSSLSPRQLISPTAYALYTPKAGASVTAGVATTANAVVDSGITSPAIAPQQVVKSLNGLKDAVTLAAGANVTLATNGNTLTMASPTWNLRGNSGTSAVNDFLGTTDNQAMEFRAGGSRILRLEPPQGAMDGPNVLGGYSGNSAGTNVVGATIAGGGAAPFILPGPPITRIYFNNKVEGHYGSIGGGLQNAVQGEKGVIGGGVGNTIASAGTLAVIPGGDFNTANGANSFAAGHRAKANHNGSFVWADTTDADFGSTANNQFLVRANGGVGINKPNPATALDVNGTISATSFSGSGSGLSGIGTVSLTDNSVNAAKLANDTGSLFKVSGGKMSANGTSVSLFVDEYLNDKDVRFRTDALHGLGWYGAGKLFAGNNVNGPALYGNGGGVLGTAGSVQKVALSWDDSQTVRIPGLLSIAGNARMNDRDILLRGGSDSNHGIGWRSSFASVNVDGPVVYGWSGGALGSISTGEQIALRWDNGGNVLVSGTTTTKALTILGGADLAEPFPMASESIAKGSVVVIDDAHAGQLRLSDRAYDTRVAGVVSGANGVNPGITLSQQGVLEGGQHVALSGRVYVQADASDGPIKPGDLLTTSGVAGHAMKAADSSRAQGAILGKAMSGLPAGRGMVLVLVTLQ